MNELIDKRREILGNLEKRVAQTRELFTADRFTSLCLRGEILDDEGAGYWATADGRIERGVSISPSAILRGAQQPDWATHVVWFNH